MNPRRREYQERIKRELHQAFTRPVSSVETPERVESELAAVGAHHTPLELRLPEALDMQGWAEIGRRLCRADQVMQWWLGDWAAFGLRKFEGVEEGNSPSPNPLPEERVKPRRGALKEFAEANGINYGTLRNLAWVSSKVPLSLRNDKLDWSKHKDVAHLPAKEQAKWLAKTAAENLVVSELRQRIRLSQGEDNALASDGPVLESGQRYLDVLLAWLHGRPQGFWTGERKALWIEKLAPVVEFAFGLKGE